MINHYIVQYHKIMLIDGDGTTLSEALDWELTQQWG
jgi:hypothetical protein